MAREYTEFEKELGIDKKDKRKDEMQKQNDSIPENIKEEVKKIIDEEFPPEKMHFGICHEIWAREKELFREKGYEWFSPQEINPMTMYD